MFDARSAARYYLSVAVSHA